MQNIIFLVALFFSVMKKLVKKAMNIRQFQVRLLFLLLLVLAGTSALFAQNQPALLDLRSCGFGCTSNNVSIPRAYLSNANGEPIDPTAIDCTSGLANVFVSVEVRNNSNSFLENARVLADIRVGDGELIRINYFIGTFQRGQTRIFTLSTTQIAWDCTSSIRLINPGVYWTPNANTNLSTSYNCSSYSNSQCERPGDILVQTALFATFFDPVITCPNEDGTYTANFTSSVVGGVAPYIYEWDFGPGANPSTSNVPSPQGVILSGLRTVSLTVRDSGNPVSEVQYNLGVGVEPLEISHILTPLTKIGATDGAITVSVTGGTEPYTFSWQGPDGFQSSSPSISELQTGIYTVTVTDDRGCVRTESFFVADLITLPVTWLDFSGVWSNQQREVRLDWSTAQEEGALYFEVQRSPMGISDFESIALIPAVGDSFEPSFYSYLDAGLDSRVSRYYYRIKQSSDDGTFSFTDVILMQRLAGVPPLASNWTAYPNPFLDNKLTLQRESFEVNQRTVSIYSTVGLQKVEFTTSEREIILDEHLSRFPKGLLIIEIREEDGPVHVIRAVKK